MIKISNILGRLFEPSTKVEALIERRRAKASSALCFFWSSITFATTVFTYRFSHPTGFKINIALVFFTAVAYFISRTKYHRISAWLFLLTCITSYGIKQHVIEDLPLANAASHLTYMVIGSLASALILPTWQAILFMIFNVSFVGFNFSKLYSISPPNIQNYIITSMVINISYLIALSLQSWFYSREAEEEVQIISHKTKVDLASSVAHSINSPLSTASLAAAYSKSAINNSSKISARVIESLARLGRGLNQSLIVVKALEIYITSQKVHFKPVDLGLVISRSIQNLGNGNISIKAPSTLGRKVIVTTDENMLESVLQLLLSFLARSNKPGAMSQVSISMNPEQADFISISIYGPADSSTPFYIANGVQAFKQQDGLTKGSNIELSILSEIIKKIGVHASVIDKKDGTGVYTLSWPKLRIAENRSSLNSSFK